MSISLKKQLMPINEISYHAPIFGGTHYDTSYMASNGHGKDTGVKDGRKMFYDFYAMEFLWSFIGSGTIPKADRERMISMDPDDPRRDIILSKSYKFLPQAMIKTIDNMYEQVTNTVAKNLLSYIRLAVIQEFQYLVNGSPEWSGFRQAITTKYNSNKNSTNKGISKEELEKYINVYIPKMRPYPETIKKLLKFSKYFSTMNTMNDRDTYDVSRKHFNNKDSDFTDDLSNADPKSPSDNSTIDEPDETDYNAKPTKRKFGKYGNGVKSPYDKDWSGNAAFNDVSDEPVKDNPEPLNEELINTDIIKNVYSAMNKSGLTMDDVQKAYNNIPWARSYGGPRWGDGVLALLKLQHAKKNLSTEDMNHIIDHIYDLQHNTGSLLNKGPMHVRDEDLNRRYRITNIARFIPFVSPSVKNLILRYQKYLHSDPAAAHDEANMEAMLNSPTIAFEPDQVEKLKALGMQSTEENKKFIVHTDFKNKKGDDIGGRIDISKHLNSEQNLAKFIVTDDLKADVKAFNSFDEAFNYINQRKHQFSAHQPSPTPPKPDVSKKQLYLDLHTTVELGADMEQRLLDIKMAYRPNNNYYKAYFQNGERVILYAFSDGSFLICQKMKSDIQIFDTWANAYNMAKMMTLDAMDNPYAVEAQKRIDAKIGKSVNSINSLVSTSQLPPNSTSTAAYKVHAGIDGIPKHTIRLTHVDEKYLMSLGFVPKYNTGDLYYINSKTGDMARFYPNNIGILSFKGTGAKSKGNIDEILAWMKNNYTPTIATNTPSQQGTKAGIMFEKTINDAGFTWDTSTNQYVDGTNTLNIAPDRSSVLSVKASHGGNLSLPFKDLASLIAYLKENYQSQKNSQNVSNEHPNSITVNENDAIQKIVNNKDSSLNLSLTPGLSGYAVIQRGTQIFLRIFKKDGIYSLYHVNLPAAIINTKYFDDIINSINYQISKLSPTSTGTSSGSNKLSNTELYSLSQIVSKFPGASISKSKINKLQESIRNRTDSIQVHDQKGHNYKITKNNDGYEVYVMLPDSGDHLEYKSPIFNEVLEFIKMRLEKSQKYLNLTNRDIATALKNKLYDDGCLGTSPISPSEYYVFGENRIAAIKIIRIFVEELGASSSLMNAKTAMENISTFLKYIAVNGIPEMKHSSLYDTLNAWNMKTNSDKNPSNDTFNALLEDAKKLNGVQLKAIGFDQTMKNIGFEWSETYKAYVNKNIHQIVCVKLEDNKVYQYHVFYVTAMGISQHLLVDSIFLLKTIGPDGTIINNEKKKSITKEGYSFKDFMSSTI